MGRLLPPLIKLPVPVPKEVRCGRENEHYRDSGRRGGSELERKSVEGERLNENRDYPGASKPSETGVD